MLRLPRSLSLGLRVRHASTAAATSSSSSTGAAARFSPLAMKAAEEVSTKWKGTTAGGGRTKNYIGGEFTESTSDRWLEVRDPVSPGIFSQRICSTLITGTIVDTDSRQYSTRNYRDRVQRCCRCCFPGIQDLVSDLHLTSSTDHVPVCPQVAHNSSVMYGG